MSKDNEMSFYSKPILKIKQQLLCVFYIRRVINPIFIFGNYSWKEFWAFRSACNLLIGVGHLFS